MTVYAPKERTLFNYQVVDGWKRLAEFVGVSEAEQFEFPHKNKLENAPEFIANLWAGTKERKQQISVTKIFHKYFCTKCCIPL